jgi:hypothetical protein
MIGRIVTKSRKNVFNKEDSCSGKTYVLLFRIVKTPAGEQEMGGMGFEPMNH